MTIRTLRYYEERGLLQSARSRTGARLFSPQQCDVALTIATLRRLGVSLAEIERIILHETDKKKATRALRTLLELRAEDLSRRLAAVKDLIGAYGIDDAA